MIAMLILILAQTPQEDEAKRTRDAVFGLPGFEQKAAPPAPPAEPVQEAPPSSFMTPRAKKTIDDYKPLLEQNVFSPPRKKDSPKEKTSDGPKSEPPKTQTHSWTLTGIMFNGVEKRYEALIENAATKEAKFLKEGDSVAGAQITSVTFDQVAYKKGETAGVLKLKESLSEVVAGGSAAPLKPEEQAEVERTRERMKKRNRRERVEDEAEEDAESRKKPK